MNRSGPISAEIAGTVEAPPLTEDFSRQAMRRRPAPVSVTTEADPDVLAWFRARGDEAERRMAALKIYAETHNQGWTASGLPSWV